MALATIEAGARAVYCVDLPKEPSAEWQKVRDYAAKMTNKGGEGRLEYITGNTTDQVCVLHASRCEIKSSDMDVRPRRRCGRLVKI